MSLDDDLRESGRRMAATPPAPPQSEALIERRHRGRRLQATALLATIALLAAVALIRPRPHQTPVDVGPPTTTARGPLRITGADGSVLSDPTITARVLMELHEHGVTDTDSLVVETGVRPVHVQSSGAAIDPRTGQIVALTADPSPKPQAGAVFFPVTMAEALEIGSSAGDRWMAPARLTSHTADGQAWTVENADGRDHGQVTMADAVRLGLATPWAAMVEAGHVGPEGVAKLAETLGVAPPVQASPTVLLGAQPVTPLEMATVYAEFANGGLRLDVHLVVRATRSGKVVYDWSPRTSPVLKPATAAAVGDAVRQGVTATTNGGRWFAIATDTLAGAFFSTSGDPAADWRQL